MLPEVRALLEIIELNTRLFGNCLDGIGDDLATRRPNAETNNVAFIALHLVDARYFLARHLGHNAVSPFPELAAVQSVDQMISFRSLGEIREAWSAISPVLGDRVRELSAEQLQSDSSTRFPVADATLLGEIAFLLQHESFHLGQLALVRKYLGSGPMKY